MIDETTQQAQRGDRTAQAKLLRDLQDPWYRFCLSLLRDPDRARDATQETALRFLRSQLRSMSSVFLLSDFITDPNVTQLAELPDLKVLAQKHDVVPIVFMDQLESNLPLGRGLLRFRSAEGREEMLLSLSSHQRSAFDALVEKRKTKLRDLFYSLGMECLFLNVGEAFMDPLMMLFERRKKV